MRAGGRATADILRLKVLREVSHSHLASLWNNPIFSKTKSRWLTEIASRFGSWFTAGAIGLAARAPFAWWPDAARSASVATAVLIVACPCALTLSAPMTLGTAMGLLAEKVLYLKHPAVALDLSRVDVIAFDKTGTLTAGAERRVLEATGLTPNGWAHVRRLARRSTHPVSRAIAGYTRPSQTTLAVTDVEETPGEGITGNVVGGVTVVDRNRRRLSRARPTSIASGDGPTRTHVRAGGESGVGETVQHDSAPRRGVCTSARAVPRRLSPFGRPRLRGRALGCDLRIANAIRSDTAGQARVHR